MCHMITLDHIDHNLSLSTKSKILQKYDLNHVMIKIRAVKSYWISFNRYAYEIKMVCLTSEKEDSYKT